MTEIVRELELFPEYVHLSPTCRELIKAEQHQITPKSRNFGLEYCQNATFCGKYQIPQIKKYVNAIPDRFVHIREISKYTDIYEMCQTGILGFAYDYELDDYVDRPEKYKDKLSKYMCVGEFDLSMRITDPFALIVANAFRSHASAFYYQEHGCSIIPTMKWSTTQSYEVCFDGYERGGVVMISTMGVLRDERSRFYFKEGFQEMLKRISPDVIIIYGEVNDWIISLVPSQLDVRYIENKFINRMRSYGR